MTDLSNTNELLAEIEKAVSDLVNLFSSLDDNKINVVPYQGSWTAGQLLRHITKSTTATAAAMQMPSQPAERDAGKRINEIRTVFLDFDHTLQSPEFIVPEEGHYNKQTSLN